MSKHKKNMQTVTSKNILSVKKVLKHKQTLSFYQKIIKIFARGICGIEGLETHSSKKRHR